MGGLLHLFDFHSNNVSRKVYSQKSRDEDLEAPRNSFELQVENFQTTQLSCGFEEEWCERSCYPVEASTRKRINEELLKRSKCKQNAPSIVAKLMGVDALTLEAKSAAWMNESVEDCRHRREVKMSEKGRRSRKERSPIATLGEMGTESLNRERYEKPKRREHPQEEELQRFKREFEAWKAARFKECTRIVDSSNNEKLPLIHTGHRVEEGMKDSDKRREIVLNDDFGCESLLVVPDQKDRLFTRTRSFGREFNLKSDMATTKIVVLKPGPQRFYDGEDSLTTSSGTIEGSRGSIEEFLEEVKDRLKSELQGRSLKRSSSVRGSGIETPFSERPLYDDDKDENDTRNVVCLGRNSHLSRSESARSYAGEVQFNALNVKETGEILNADDQEDERSQSFRRGNDVEDRVAGKRDSSPRNLIRSLSAPMSGTSFGKLLLEDRHVLTGGRIQRKQEAVEQEPYTNPIRRKERFNFRKKVSSFRSTLRGRIFGKKIRSMIESNSFDDEYIKDFVTGSRNENSTEVPPSPASVCSTTIPEEFWRNVDYLSPVSTPDVTISDENGVPRVFRDISSNLSELRRQINELASDIQEDAPVEQEANQELEFKANPDKEYVEDLLVASGLYEGTSARSLSRWDPFEKLINKSVFEEIEENHRKIAKQNTEKAETEHRILFDLLNEALVIVLGPPVRNFSFRGKVMSSSGLTPPRGKYLLEVTWQIMSEYLCAQTEKLCSLDGIIAWDLGSSPWTGLVDDEVDVLGRGVEGLIMADLVEDLTKDLQQKLLLPC